MNHLFLFTIFGLGETWSTLFAVALAVIAWILLRLMAVMIVFFHPVNVMWKTLYICKIQETHGVLYRLLGIYGWTEKVKYRLLSDVIPGYIFAHLYSYGNFMMDESQVTSAATFYSKLYYNSSPSEIRLFCNAILGEWFSFENEKIYLEVIMFNVGDEKVKRLVALQRSIDFLELLKNILQSRCPKTIKDLILEAKRQYNIELTRVYKETWSVQDANSVTINSVKELYDAMMPGEMKDALKEFINIKESSSIDLKQINEVLA